MNFFATFLLNNFSYLLVLAKKKYLNEIKTIFYLHALKILGSTKDENVQVVTRTSMYCPYIVYFSAVFSVLGDLNHWCKTLFKYYSSFGKETCRNLFLFFFFRFMTHHTILSALAVVRCVFIYNS